MYCKVPGEYNLPSGRTTHSVNINMSATALPMDSQGMFTLEQDSGIRLEYLAEGAANIIYRPLGPPPSPSAEADLGFTPDGTTGTPPATEIEPLLIDPCLEGKLIRLRKDLSTVLPVATSWNHFHNVISPLFLDSQLVSQALFKVSRKVIMDLNTDLRRLETDGGRSRKRHGLYLAADESYGTLITDVSSDGASVCLEFKPKWLIQSPSAPPGSKRCRTCALRAMKQAKQHLQEEAEAAGIGFCPLSLASGDRFQVAAAIDQILCAPRHSELRGQQSRDSIVEWVLNSPLVKRLKQLQAEMDPIGILEAELISRNFLTAMTLRDCTLFVKVYLCSRYCVMSGG